MNRDVDAKLTFEDDVWARIADVQRGDMEKFGTVYERYAPSLFKHFLAMKFDFATAEDLTSETFVRALYAIDSVSNRGNDLWAWLVTIARNLAKDYVRAARTRCEIVSGEMSVYAKSTVDAPDSRIAAIEELDQVAEWLRNLPTEQRRCVLLRRVLDLTVSETAARMNRSNVAVRALLHRASARLNTAKAS